MVKRILIYIAGIFILGLGLVLTTKTGLGTSPIVSMPFALSQLTSLTLGTWTFIFYMIFVTAQIIMYRKIDARVLLQIPFSFVMGKVVDFYNVFITIKNPILPLALIMTIIAIFLTALGAFCMIQMDLIVNPADGFVNGLTYITKKPFGIMKMSFDSSCIIVTLIISMVGAHHILGIGIGTFMCAFLTGTFMTYLDKFLGRKMANIVLDSKHIAEFND